LKDFRKKQYRFWVSRNFEELQKFLDSKENFSDYARKTFSMIQKENLDPETFETLKKLKIKADIEWKNSQTEYNKMRIAKWKQHDVSKTEVEASEAETAHFPPEEKTLEDLIEHHWNNFVNSLRQYKEGWTVTCKLCETGFPQLGSKEVAIQRLKQHLRETHSEELVRSV